MNTPVDRDVACPRCRYNLRGLTTPRCPECGFEFDFKDLATGLLRENIPTWLDRCDPWQPHQVLVRSLYETARGALRPRRAWTKLDVNGPLVPAWLMLIVGTLLVALLTAAIMATAIIFHTGASPAAATHAALRIWTPRLLLAGFGSAIAVIPRLLTPNHIRASQPRMRQRFRLVAHLTPAIVLTFSILFAAIACTLPDLALHGSVVVLCFLFIYWLTPAHLDSRGRGSLMQFLVVTACLFIGTGIVILAMVWHRPDSLAPPWHVYSF